MLQVAGGKWQVATGECPPARAKGLCVVSFHPFMPHSHAKLFRLHCNCKLLLWVGGNGNGDSPLSTVPSFFTFSSPVLCKLLLWQHVALVFMAGWPGSVHFQLG